ncbi:MAG: glycosyltransferase family 4 protein [Alphaproteobacteria bacterium]
MRIGFYAPLKPPHHPVPSGDRLVARLLMRALVLAGHSVELMASVRTYCATPGLLPEAERAAAAASRRLVRMLPARPFAQRPQAWLTYHLYYKAPDWIGPAVASALDIPYLVAEASSAPKRLAGPWVHGERAVAAALARADAVLSLNPADEPAVSAHLDRPDRIRPLLPFLDLDAPPAQPADRAANRAAVAARYGLPADRPWLLAVAMMREGDKLASYRMLGEALARLQDLRWHLVAAGDGPARTAVAAALGPRASLVGALGPAALAEFYACADILVWPAVNEAFGMALLEARAAGLPVVAGDQGGVATIVEHGRSGLVVSPPGAAGIAGAVRELLSDAGRRRAMADYARATTAAKHGLAAAAAVLDDALRFVLAHRRQA